MFVLAIVVGIYSYLIFFLGLFHLLSKGPIIFVTIFYFGGVLGYYRAKILRDIQKWYRAFRKLPKEGYLFVGLFLLFILQAIINFVGVLGPEISFDALWYHLTLPKIYLQHHSVFYVPGGLFYYSVTPKLTEMLYTAAISISGETLAKCIHFLFGLLCCIALYQLTRKYTNKIYGLLAILVFYGNLVVGWESITAYTDLARTFYELLALVAFLQFVQKKTYKWLFLFTLMLGFAMTVKILSLTSLVIYLPLLSVVLYKQHLQFKKIIVLCISIVVGSLLVPAPWLLFSYLTTHNAFYPFFSQMYPTPLSSLNPVTFMQTVYSELVSASDPISPMYIITVPIMLIVYKRMPQEIKYVSWYSILAIVVWYITPQTGGGRFLLPFLPGFSFLAAVSIYLFNDKLVKKILISIAIICMFLSLGYRGIANSKFLPVIVGQETKSQFLTKHLNFSFGDFYDTDNYFATHIKKTDTVLLYGFHNEYYVDFPFVDSSFIKKGDRFNYIAVQNTQLPARFSALQKVYLNKQTNVVLYSLKGRKWDY